MSSPRPDFRQHLTVETPEHVLLDYEVAGIGSRTLAAIIDHTIMLALLLGLLALARWSRASWMDSTIGPVVLAFGGFVIVWGYFTLCEAFWRGQTPGKRYMGIRVIRDTGHAARFGDVAARNLLRIADFLPPPYLLGAIMVAVHPRAKRLGDLVAGTVVVRDRPQEAQVGEAFAAPTEGFAEPPEAAGPPELTNEEFRVLREYAERAADLPPDARLRLAARIANRFSDRYPNRPPQNEIFLGALYRQELSRRRGLFGGRAGRVGQPRQGGMVVDRLVARKSERWNEFALLADRAVRHGLDGFAAPELPDFAARYREVAADLARVRTYGGEPGLRSRLERLVAAGHNALYRDERHTWSRIWKFFSVECPAAVVTARRYVFLATLAFALPGAAGYLLLREQPALASEVLPEIMLERAEAGVARSQSGHGYYEAPAGERPGMASAIITNNLTVAFNCFAGGIFLGVGSLVFLAFNGLQMGAASGHFANLGLLKYLWLFVIGHGVLELFAIWVAGAAGFMLGKAIIAPGELTRHDALVLSGRLAMRMIGAAVVLLLIAGIIEGFVSSSTAPTPMRLGVSGASTIFLALYLIHGARHAGLGNPA